MEKLRSWSLAFGGSRGSARGLRSSQRRLLLPHHWKPCAGCDRMTRPEKCSDCGAPIDEALDRIAGERQPCPCGSTRRTVTVHARLGFVAEITPRQMYRWGARRAQQWGKDGWELFRVTRTWRLVRRLFDKGANTYEERILDGQTLQVIKECKEPLTEHRGHGSARKRKGS
jgi:hypothetical protein